VGANTRTMTDPPASQFSPIARGSHVPVHRESQLIQCIARLRAAVLCANDGIILTQGNESFTFRHFRWQQSTHWVRGMSIMVQWLWPSEKGLARERPSILPRRQQRLNAPASEVGWERLPAPKLRPSHCDVRL